MSQMITPLDQAQAAIDASNAGDSEQLSFYARLLDTELTLLLQSQPDDENIEPQIFDLQDGPVVLAFDLEERLAEFVGQAAPMAMMSGRQLIRLLAGSGIGLGVNLDVAPSATLLDTSTLSWIAEMIEDAPDEVHARAEEILPPVGVPEMLLRALDAKLARTAGLADAAFLVGIQYEDGVRGHLLALIDPMPGAEDALARAVSDALRFSGVEAGMLDTGFFRASDPVSAKLAKVGLRFDLPRVTQTDTRTPIAPGRDPDKPPILR